MSQPVFLFPGQGSQVVGMGRDLYDAFASVRDIFTAAADVAGFDVAAVCFDGPMETLTETRFLQPAMTAMVLSCYQAALEKETLQPPAFMAGHSLGEYAALAAAGVFSFEDALRLTTARGKLMQEQAEANPGAMAAILKLPADTVKALIEETALEHDLCLANFNAPLQLVASGSETGIQVLMEKAREQKGRVSQLKVSGAWHSPLMKGAEEPFNAVIDDITFHTAKVPVLLNVTGEPEQEGKVIKARMKAQMCSGVQWCPAMLHAWEEGSRLFVEFGPKGVLGKMLKTIVPDKTLLETRIIDSVQADWA
ncbi:ACP S-malonyltransferase [Acanthopleuribacter pedis]|uniref:Malonyl CoA-acyl carrier protein transacylase n=1 Tax=Acanthopleuribacter pedis TaxID=442870 RepID=A0A8J7U8C9_9BACT|nr:ACP S-malonyltransferase [Acanthopleuribacter pedis]MBO1322401.1 ACP S-malonyltransferase [Acanthopleuribacter pedis]